MIGLPKTHITKPLTVTTVSKRSLLRCSILQPIKQESMLSEMQVITACKWDKTCWSHKGSYFSQGIYIFYTGQLLNSKQWQIQDFPQGGVPTAKLRLFCNFFAENCMKMKEFGLPGARVPGTPLRSVNGKERTKFCLLNELPQKSSHI